VRARTPRIVYGSISAFGQTGPYRNRPAHDLAVQAISGAQSLTLGMDGRPAMTGVAVADIVSGLHALSGILMALLRARTTGRGDYIDISMHEAALASFPNVLGPVFASGEQPDVGKSRTGGGAAFYQIYETKDGRHLALGGQEPKFAAALLTWLDRPDLLPVCALPPGSQEPVIAFLRERFLSKTLAEWQEELAALDVCFGPVNSLPEALADPHVAEREIVLIDAAGRRHLAPVIRFRDEPARISFAVPGHGEHTGATLGTASATRAT
jgi:crotonobetainyl-CoA:carnitine CoA-transferase CaiB-like acyl-CoA transferase